MTKGASASYTQKRFKIDFKRFGTFLITVIGFVSFAVLCVDFCRFPEKYLSTYRYQLHNDIISGDENAIEYYNSTYISKGVYLYGETDYITTRRNTKFED